MRSRSSRSRARPCGIGPLLRSARRPRRARRSTCAAARAAGRSKPCSSSATTAVEPAARLRAPRSRRPWRSSSAAQVCGPCSVICRSSQASTSPCGAAQLVQQARGPRRRAAPTSRCGAAAGAAPGRPGRPARGARWPTRRRCAAARARRPRAALRPATGPTARPGRPAPCCAWRGQLGQQLALQRAVGQGLPQRPGLRQHARAAFGGAEVGALGRHARSAGATAAPPAATLLSKASAPSSRTKLSGSCSGGRNRKRTLRRSVACGRRGLERAAGGAAAGGVAVEAEDHRVGEAEQLLHMLGRAGGAERGHGIGEARSAPARPRPCSPRPPARSRLLAQRRARLEQAVQLAALD